MEKNKKQFIRTVPGKALLFLMINILMIAVLACTCAAAACIQEDLYGISEEEFYKYKSEDYLEYKVMENSNYLIGIDHYAVEGMNIMITDMSIMNTMDIIITIILRVNQQEIF